MGFIEARGNSFYYEDKGVGVPILLVHPAGATASTWGSAADDLIHVGRVLAYDRRGYERSGGKPVRSIPEHTADAASILETLHASPAVVVGTSVGATIAIDLALHRPGLVRTVIAYESPWRATHHASSFTSASALRALARMQWLMWRGRHAEAAEVFLRWAYTYRDGGSAWDVQPEEWRRTARRNAKAVVADIRIAMGGYPPPRELAKVTSPVVCAYGARSGDVMVGISRSLARAIPKATLREVEGAGHAVLFDAPGTFAQVIAEMVQSSQRGLEA